MLDTSQIRNGLKIIVDEEPWEITDFLHVKPGKGGAFIRTTLKNLKTGSVQEETFRATEKLEPADIETREMQFLYESNGEFVFMDKETYEQIILREEAVKDSIDFLTENTDVEIMFWQEKAINIDLPIFVELEITDTEPGVEGDTATGGTKPAIVETGVKLKVPLFLNEGDVIKVDTRTKEYVERV